MNVSSRNSSMSKCSINSYDSGIADDGPDQVESMERAKRIGNEVLDFIAMKKGKHEFSSSAALLKFARTGDVY